MWQDNDKFLEEETPQFTKEYDDMVLCVNEGHIHLNTKKIPFSFLGINSGPLNLLTFTCVSPLSFGGLLDQLISTATWNDS